MASDVLWVQSLCLCSAAMVLPLQAQVKKADLELNWTPASLLASAAAKHRQLHYPAKALKMMMSYSNLQPQVQMQFGWQLVACRLLRETVKDFLCQDCTVGVCQV